MKRLLIGLVAFGSLTVMANDYTQDSFLCRIHGSQASVSSPGGVFLPNEIILGLRTTRIVGSQKLVKIEYDSDDFKVPEFSKAVPVKYFDRLSWEYGLKFPKFSRSESKILLEKLGAKAVPNLKSGFSFEPVWVSDTQDPAYLMYSAGRSIAISQLHFKPSQNDGLSYHVTVSCEQR